MIIIILKYFIISWALSGMINQISEFIPDSNIIFLILKLILGCAKCVSFWITLILTLNLFTAATVGFIMFLYKKIEDKYLSDTRL